MPVLRGGVAGQVKGSMCVCSKGHREKWIGVQTWVSGDLQNPLSVAIGGTSSPNLTVYTRAALAACACYLELIFTDGIVAESSIRSLGWQHLALVSCTLVTDEKSSLWAVMVSSRALLSSCPWGLAGASFVLHLHLLSSCSFSPCKSPQAKPPGLESGFPGLKWHTRVPIANILIV